MGFLSVMRFMTAGFLTDLRHGLRQLIHSPSFTLPAIAGLALSIGATTSVFSVVKAMMLSPMGMTGTDRLVALWRTDARRGQKHVEVCYADLIDWRNQKDLFEDVALVSSVNLDFPLLGDGEPQQVDGTTVSGSFFKILGTKAALGRLFTEDDDVPGAPLRVIISQRLWKTRYGADPNIIGRQIRAGDGSATVIGVNGPHFDFPRDVDLWVPLRAAWPTVEKQPRLRVFRSVGRLKHGVSVAEAQARLNVLAVQSEKTVPPGSEGFGVLATPILDEIFGSARIAVWVLLGAVVLVLLIACANVANLLLARAAVRGRELAIRSVLGAQRARLVRLLLSESLLLSVLAGLLGLALALGGVTALARLAPPDVPRIGQARIDRAVLLFGIGISLVTVLVFGLAPALIASRRDPNDTLKQAGRTASADRGHTKLRSALVLSEVAVSVILLVGAALLVRSFRAMAAVDPGFDPEQVLSFRITTATGEQEKRRAMFGSILDRIRSLPGVESAGAILIRPLSGLVGWDTVYTVEGQTAEEQSRNPNGNYQAISPEYFRTMGIRVLSGRDFSRADTHTSPGVVIVNVSTVRRHWPDGNAIGRQLRLGKDPKTPWLTVVGVVDDVRYREWEAVRSDFYVPYTQRAQHRSDFVVKVSGEPAALVPAIRREVLSIDKNQPVSNLTTMEALVDRGLARSRFNSMVLAVLAAAAVLLAAIGIYGVLSYSVAQRTSEIGIRMAVGATRGKIVSLVASNGVRLTAIGAAAGLAGAAAASRLLSSLLFEVEAFDPLSYVGSALVLAVVAAAACLVPAWRAASVDPGRLLQTTE